MLRNCQLIEQFELWNLAKSLADRMKGRKSREGSISRVKVNHGRGARSAMPAMSTGAARALFPTNSQRGK